MLRRLNQAFSIIELLVVLAIIAILYTVTIPVGTHLRVSTLSLKTKAQFGQYILAIEAYQQEYGHPPPCLKINQPVNLQDIAEDLIAALSGRTLDGHPLPNDQAATLNRKRICFYNFPEMHLQKPHIKDAFNNPDIFIIVKANHSIEIPQSAFPADIQTLVPIEGVRASVAIYTLPTEQHPAVVSW